MSDDDDAKPSLASPSMDTWGYRSYNKEHKPLLVSPEVSTTVCVFGCCLFVAITK
jgi:hypothetical protein